MSKIWYLVRVVMVAGVVFGTNHHLRNAVTGLMRDIGYGKGYEYAHDIEQGVSAQTHLPDNLAGRTWYQPTQRGFEATLTERLARIRSIVTEQRNRKN